MITVLKGDILKTECQVLVNPVNCVGIMGAGLAKKIKEIFPKTFEDYVLACKYEQIKPGVIKWHSSFDSKSPIRYIVSFPTKDHWRDKSNLIDIRSALKELKATLAKCRRSIFSVAIPALGCGLGGLQWMDVKGLIEHELKDLTQDIELYEPL